MENQQNTGKESIVSRELGVDMSPLDIINENRTSETIEEQVSKPTEKTVEGVVEKKEEPKPAEKQEEVVENTPKSKEVVSEEKEEEGDKPEETPKIKGNPLKVFAEHYKTLGRLPEDFEVSEDISQDEFDKAVYEHKKSDYISLAKNELIEEQKQRGITDEVLERAIQFSNGATEQELSELQYYGVLRDFEFNPKDELYEQDVKDYLKLYYKTLTPTLDEKKVETLVNTDMSDKKNLQNTIENARDTFKTKVESITTEQADKKRKAEEDRENKARKKVESIKSVVMKESIDGVKYSEEQKTKFLKAYLVKSEVYKDENGNSYKVTPYTKKVLEYSKDPEKSIRQKMDFFFGLDKKEVSKVAEKKATRKLMEGLNELIESSTDTSKKAAGDVVGKTGIVSRALGE